MTWNLRLVNMGGDDPWVELREVFYDHKGNLLGHTTATISGENMDEIKTTFHTKEATSKCFDSAKWLM